MNRFGENPKAFFAHVYNQDVPWEIGSIQPELMKLIRANPPSGRILDIGCGSGDTAIDIARLGYEVVGVDFVEQAIQNAKKKAAELTRTEKLDISFICGDGSQPSTIGRNFGAIIDSGFLHLLDDDEARKYVDDLNRALTKRGRVYLIEFALEFEIPNAPRAITQEVIRGLFIEEKWSIASLFDCAFLNKISPVPAVVACIEKVD